uniref:Uncharacterized protein n=1 Tax=Romanomermis culicivorax TaxID=13658 RepID=A0A915KST0_ROMCU
MTWDKFLHRIYYNTQHYALSWKDVCDRTRRGCPGSFFSCRCLKTRSRYTDPYRGYTKHSH